MKKPHPSRPPVVKNAELDRLRALVRALCTAVIESYRPGEEGVRAKVRLLGLVEQWNASCPK